MYIPYFAPRNRTDERPERRIVRFVRHRTLRAGIRLGGRGWSRRSCVGLRSSDGGVWEPSVPLEAPLERNQKHPIAPGY
jgi:hypothetical protein